MLVIFFSPSAAAAPLGGREDLVGGYFHVTSIAKIMMEHLTGRVVVRVGFGTPEKEVKLLRRPEIRDGYFERGSASSDYT